MKYYIYLFLLLCSVLGACNDDNDGLAKKSYSQVVDEDDDDTKATLNDDYFYQLPLIFHVLYQDIDDPTQYVPVSRIQSLVVHLNELYQGHIYGESENIRVRFFLAQYDEEGHRLKTPGVDYIKYTGKYPIDVQEFMNDNNRKYVKYLWEPNEYINVFLYHFSSEKNAQTLGISHLPYVVKGSTSLEGLETIQRSYLSKKDLSFAYCTSINSTFINSESTRYQLSDKGKSGYQYLSTDVNVTLAHELGHYLGLHHTFTEKKVNGNYEAIDECFDTDYCKDTPSYNKVDYNKWLNEYLRFMNKRQVDMKRLVMRNNCAGETFDADNIMDYAIGYGFRFTKEQKNRIRQVLYYSPLIPGPKKNRSKSRALRHEDDEVYQLPIQTIR